MKRVTVVLVLCFLLSFAGSRTAVALTPTPSPTPVPTPTPTPTPTPAPFVAADLPADRRPARYLVAAQTEGLFYWADRDMYLAYGQVGNDEPGFYPADDRRVGD